jgi:hypothetical protein
VNTIVWPVKRLAAFAAGGCGRSPASSSRSSSAAFSGSRTSRAPTSPSRGRLVELVELLDARGAHRVERPERLREQLCAALTDLGDAQREEEPVEGRCLRGLEAVEEVLHARLALAFEGHEAVAVAVEREQVRGVREQRRRRVEQLAYLLGPEPEHVEAAARDEVEDARLGLRGAGAVRAPQRDLLRVPDERGGAREGSASAPRAGPRVRAALRHHRPTLGITSPRARRRPRRRRARRGARPSALWSVALTVTPPTATGSRSATGLTTPVRPTLTTPLRRVVAPRAGNFHATAQRGERLRMPSRSCSAVSSTLTTTPSISNGSVSRATSTLRKCATTASRPATPTLHSLTGKPQPRSSARASVCEATARPSSFAIT